jgi:sulfur carrier protein ThiS
MKIQVALFTSLSKYLPEGTQNRRASIEVKDGATLRDVLNQLGIPPELPNILLVNGRQAPDTTVLKEEETLSVFPPLAGGGPFPSPAPRRAHTPRPRGPVSVRRNGSAGPVGVPSGILRPPGDPPEGPCPSSLVSSRMT